jgi:uncharacterized protein YjdB
VKNVTSIRTPLKNLFLQRGKSLTLPVVLDDGTAPKTSITSELTWESSNKKVLAVSAQGKINANKMVRKKTKVNVTAMAANGRKLTVKVTVVPMAQKLRAVTAKFPKMDRMKAGATYELKAQIKKASATGVEVRFQSSKASVIRVDKAGKLFALKRGKATITIEAGGKSVRRTIMVK